MQREVWAFAEAWVAIWREVGGSKSGDALLDDSLAVYGEAKLLRNLSLSERPNIVRKQQPGSSADSIVVNGVQNTFKMEKGYLSKETTAAITDPSWQYRIELSLVNPRYDDTQDDDSISLYGCTTTTKGFSGKDDSDFEEEVVYDVERVA